MSEPGPPRRRTRRRLVLVLAAAALALLAAGGAAAYLLARAPGDVVNPEVEFTAEPPVTTTTTPERRAVRKDTFVWPTYGYTKARTRYLPSEHVGPPFRRRWTLGGRTLIEFPPVIDGKWLFLVKNDGFAQAVSKRTGKRRWRKRVGRLAAASPAVGNGRVFVVALRGLRGSGGRVAALDEKTGRTLWSRALPSRAESSPLLYRGRVLFGSENGTVYALRARDGAVRWTYKAPGAVKGALALANGRLYFGDYAGEVHAVKAADGKEAWSTGTSGGSFGRSGTFYSTAAVDYGRVYIGNTDGRVYSFSARTGKLAWAKRTGGYVYASPAVATIPRLGPTVYIGSYDGKLYALDARTGRVRWSHDAGGKISGSATIVGDVVYFSNLAAKTTRGLDVRTGRKVFAFGSGAFNPVVSDGRWIFLTGYAGLFGLQPKKGATAASVGDGKRS